MMLTAEVWLSVGIRKTQVLGAVLVYRKIGLSRTCKKHGSGVRAVRERRSWHVGGAHMPGADARLQLPVAFKKTVGLSKACKVGTYGTTLTSNT